MAREFNFMDEPREENPTPGDLMKRLHMAVSQYGKGQPRPPFIMIMSPQEFDKLRRARDEGKV